VTFHFTFVGVEPNGSLLKCNLFVPDLIPKKLLQRVSNTTEKGAEMADSKGNFMDFIEEASEPSSPLRQQFLDELYKAGVTADDLLKLFHGWNYNGVSLEDCGKLLTLASRGPLPCDFSVKY
jgi:hypothetical protein